MTANHRTDGKFRVEEGALGPQPPPALASDICLHAFRPIAPRRAGAAISAAYADRVADQLKLGCPVFRRCSIMLAEMTLTAKELVVGCSDVRNGPEGPLGSGLCDPGSGER